MDAALRLPDSLWAKSARACPPFARLEGEHEAAVLVVGGGYSGLSTALHLAERGLRVALLEAGEVGHGASGRNNGQVIPHHTIYSPAEIEQRFGTERGSHLNRFVRDAAAYTFDLIRRHGIDCDAVQNGWVQPAHAASKVNRSRLLAEQWAERGADVRFVDKPALDTLLGTADYYGGWYAASGGHVNPLALARGLAVAAAKAGAAIFTQSPASSLVRRGDRWRATTPRGAITADRVFIAVNAYPDGPWPGLERTVIPIRVYQLATAPLSDNLRKTILPTNVAMSDTRGDLRFFHYDRDGRLVTGGSHAVWINARARGERSRGALLSASFPQLGEVTFDHYWDGLIDLMPDRLPRILRLAEGVHAVNGYSGRGLAFACALGRDMAAYIAGAEEQALPLPVSLPEPMRLHGLVRFGARFARMAHRWRDARA